MEKKFKFSVIIPVYNVEEYLAETIDSVINQSIGFKDNIQIILVNDGSPDNSEEICLEYKEKYPDNIIYIKQENAGVSAARNNGLNYIQGEYVNFLDSDDKWEPNAYQEALNLFAKYKDINSVFFPLKFFEKTKKEHILNKFYKNKEKIDIRKDYKCVKLQTCSIIFKREALLNYRFDLKLKISEDAKLLTEFFLDYPVAGMAKSFYLYRKRKSGTSAIQTSIRKKTWYLDTPKYCYLYLINLSKEKYHKVINYIQFLLAYDIKWRLDIDYNGILNEKEKEEYKQLLKNVIDHIDDDIIADCEVYEAYEKIYLLNFKHQNKCKYTIKDNNVYYKNMNLFELKNIPIIIDSIYIEKDLLDFYIRMPKIENIIEKIYFKDSKGKKYLPDYYELDSNSKYLGKIDKNSNSLFLGAKISVPLTNKSNINLYASNNELDYKVKMEYSYASFFNNKFKKLNLKTDNFIVNQNDDGLKVYKKNILKVILKEIQTIVSLLKMKQFVSIGYRLLANLYKIIKFKPIWIISDRIQAASDNGQAFFEYLMHQNIKNKKIYFDIGKNCQDYQILSKKYPKNIIKHKSLKHKILFLNADLILSSQADNYVYNLFGNGKYYIGDLYNFKFVFLQHGVTYNNLSPWLNVNSRKIDLIITASEREKKSIVEDYRYNYPKGNVSTTGFARYDKLFKSNNEIKNQIVIMPTWRNKLVSEMDLNTGLRKYNPNFKNTDYFKFYNNLINHPKLLKALKKFNYKIKFIPHPIMIPQLKDFTTNDYVFFEKNSIDYTKEFQENKLLITDYSSVFFDFAYLKKPIIYTQFDEKDFYEGQLYDKGYFDFSKDGYGKVTYNIEDTIEEIINILNNNCKMEQKYLNRVENFFKYNDSNNCERIYKEILNKLKIGDKQ